MNRLSLVIMGLSQHKDSTWAARHAIPAHRLPAGGLDKEATAIASMWARNAALVPNKRLSLHLRLMFGAMNGTNQNYLSPWLLRNQYPGLRASHVFSQTLWAAGVRDCTRYVGKFDVRDLSRQSLVDLTAALIYSQDQYARLWPGGLEFVDKSAVLEAGTIEELCWMTLSYLSNRMTGCEPEMGTRIQQIKPPLHMESRLFRDRLIAYKGRTPHPILSAPLIEVLATENADAEFASWLSLYPNVRLVVPEVTESLLRACDEANVLL